MALAFRCWSSVTVAVLMALVTLDSPAKTGTTTSTKSPASQVVLAPRLHTNCCGLDVALVTQAAVHTPTDDRSAGQVQQTALYAFLNLHTQTRLLLPEVKHR